MIGMLTDSTVRESHEFFELLRMTRAELLRDKQRKHKPIHYRPSVVTVDVHQLN